MSRKEQERKSRIFMIRKKLKEAKAENLEIIDKKLILDIAEIFGCSVRTAKEYFEIAKNYNEENNNC